MKFPALISVNIAIYTLTLTLTLTLPLTLPYPSAPWRPERRGTNLRRPRFERNGVPRVPRKRKPWEQWSRGAGASGEALVRVARRWCEWRLNGKPACNLTPGCVPVSTL